MKTLIETKSIGGGYYVCKYRIDPPVPYSDRYLNRLCGPQTTEFIIKRNK